MKTFRVARYRQTHWHGVMVCLLWIAIAPHLVAQESGGWIALEKCQVVDRKVEIPALDRGFVKALHVELNQSVAAVQLLAELDTDLAELELRLAQLELEQAKALATDDADIKYHLGALKKIEEDLARYRSIDKSVSDAEIRGRELGVDQAKLALDRARSAQRRAQGDVKLKEVAVEAAKLRLSRRRITAPYAGVVTAIKIFPGQFVETGQAIVVIEDLENLQVDCLVPIQRLNVREMVNAEVRVDVEQLGGEKIRLSGKITSTDPRLSPGGLVRVHALIKNVQRGGMWVLWPGMDVTMFVANGSRAEGSQVQRTSLPTSLR